MQLAMKPATIASEESNSEEDSEASGIETNDDSDDSNDKVYNEINTKNGKDESSNETVQGEESIDTLTDQDNIIGLQNGILIDDTPDITTKYASNYSKTVKNNYHTMAGIIHDNESLDGLDVNNCVFPLNMYGKIIFSREFISTFVACLWQSLRNDTTTHERCSHFF